MATFRSTAANSTAVQVTNQAAQVRLVSVCNRHSAVIYVRLYNTPNATFQDTPVLTVAVPATAQIFLSPPTQTNVIETTSGLSVRAVTDTAENGTTAPGTLPEIVIKFE